MPKADPSQTGGAHWTVTWLDKVRERRGITIKQMLALMGRAKRETYANWRNGINQPKIGDIEDMARALGFKIALEELDEQDHPPT